MLQSSMSHFWEGLKAGKFVPKTDEEIKEFIKQNHFAGEPLIPLAEEDREIIYQNVFKIFSCLVNNNDYVVLCNPQVMYDSKIMSCNVPWHYFIFEECSDFVHPNKKSLTFEEKFELLSNPDVWYNGRLIDQNCEGPLTGWGMRYLQGYGYSHENFLKILSRVRQNTGKNLVNLLDIGGGMGVMLNEVKKLDENIITNNMVLDIAPTSYNFDNLYLCPAERFPSKLRENIDLMFANMAFLYMPGQSLALENCLQSLSVGGEAFLSVEWGKQDVFIQDSPMKMVRQYARMKRLMEEGFIDLKISCSSHYAHPFDYKPKANDSSELNSVFFPPADLEIRKLKSLKD